MRLAALAAALFLLTGCWKPKPAPVPAAASPTGKVRMFKNEALIATCTDVSDEWKLSGCVVAPGHDLDEVLSTLLYQLEQKAAEAQAAEEAKEPDCSVTKTRYRIVRM